MSFYGSVYYQFVDAFTKIIGSNNGKKEFGFMPNESTGGEGQAIGRSNVLSLDSGNYWIDLEKDIEVTESDPSVTAPFKIWHSKPYEDREEGQKASGFYVDKTFRPILDEETKLEIGIEHYDEETQKWVQVDSGFTSLGDGEFVRIYHSNYDNAGHSYSTDGKNGTVYRFPRLSVNDDVNYLKSLVGEPEQDKKLPTWRREVSEEDKIDDNLKKPNYAIQNLFDYAELNYEDIGTLQKYVGNWPDINQGWGTGAEGTIPSQTIAEVIGKWEEAFVKTGNSKEPFLQLKDLLEYANLSSILGRLPDMWKEISGEDAAGKPVFTSISQALTLLSQKLTTTITELTDDINTVQGHLNGVDGNLQNLRLQLGLNLNDSMPITVIDQIEALKDTDVTHLNLINGINELLGSPDFSRPESGTVFNHLYDLYDEIALVEERAENANTTLKEELKNDYTSLVNGVGERVTAHENSTTTSLNAITESLNSKTAEITANLNSTAAAIRREFKEADDVLDDRIDEVILDIDNMDRSYKEADISLEGLITNLDLAYKEADATLSKNISDLEANYLAANSILQGNIDNISSAIGSASDLSTATTVYGAINNIKETYATQKYVSDSYMTKTDGLTKESAEATYFKQTNAVTLQNEVDDISNNLQTLTTLVGDNNLSEGQTILSLLSSLSEKIESIESRLQALENPTEGDATT